MQEKSYGKQCKIHVIYQKNLYDCGVAALMMIFQYYHRNISTQEIKKYIKINQDGCSAKDIVECARMYDFIAKGLKVSTQKLINIRHPLILFLKYNHYVVYTGYKSDYIYLIDPLEGKQKLNIEEFSKIYSGIALDIHPNNSKNNTNFSNMKMISSYTSYYMDILFGLILVAIFLVTFLIVNLMLSCIKNYSYSVNIIKILLIVSIILGIKEVIVRQIMRYNMINKTVIYKEKLFGIPIVYFLYDKLGIKREQLTNIIIYSLCNVAMVISCYLSTLIVNLQEEIVVIGLINLFFIGVIYIFLNRNTYLDARKKYMKNIYFRNKLIYGYQKKNIIKEITITVFCLLCYKLIMVLFGIYGMDLFLISHTIINVICSIQIFDIVVTIYRCKLSLRYELKRNIEVMDYTNFSSH